MDLNSEAKNVEQILLTLSYSNPHQTLKHVMQVLRFYGGLRVESKYFVVNNGVEKPTKLLSITGTIPVTRGGENCRVGVVIWVPKSYPVVNPSILLIPKSKSAEGLPEVDGIEAPIDAQPKCQLIDVHGKVDISELRCLVLKISKTSMNHKNPYTLAKFIFVLNLALNEWTPPAFIALDPQRFVSRLALTLSSVRTPSRLATTLADLTAKLVNHDYKNVEQTASHILAATARFPTLNPFFNEFFHNNGTAEKLVTVSGVLELENGGNIYNLQILIWLPKVYPAEDPVVFVKCTNDDISSRITSLDFMDRFGKVDFRICHWYHSNLMELIENLWEKWRADLFDCDSDDEVEVIMAKSCLSGRSPFPKRVDKLVDDHWREEASTPAVSTEPQGISVTATYSLSNIEPSAAGNDKMDQNQPLENHWEFEQIQTFANDACVICDDPSEVIRPGGDAPLSEDEANQLMTLCRNMMPNQSDIPKVIRREMFPFCASCKELSKELWECNIRMEKIKSKIESKVVEEVILSGDPIPSEEANNGKRFMKLRSVIYEGYLNKLRLKKNERLAEKNTAANPPPPIISSENNGKPSEKNPMEDENSRYELPLEVERSVTSESIMNLEVEEESRSGAEEQEFGDPLFEEEHTMMKVEAEPENTDEQVVSLNAPVSVPRTRSGSAKTSEGTLLVEVEGASVKLIWTKDLSTSKAFMECSFENCNHSVPFGTAIEEMNEAYESCKEHIQRNHKDEADLLAKRFGKQQHFECPLHPTCKLQFADSVSTDKHEIIHRSCGLCGKKFGKIAFYKNPSLMLSHKCPQKLK